MIKPSVQLKADKELKRQFVDKLQNGTTANRPTANLKSGDVYFDESLGTKGKPIWRNKTNDGWVDATGTAV